VGALDIYRTRVRRLLTDGQGQFFSDVELTDHINQARVRVASDTKCLRQLILNVTLPANQELYNIVETVNDGIPPNLGLNVIEVLGVTIYWGNMRVRCLNRPFTEQDAKLRIWQYYQSRPGSLAMMGANTLYLNPTPDQPYQSDWDVVLVPHPLTTSSDLEVLPVVFQPLVQFYAAHLAKYTEQSISESDIFFRKYLMERQAMSWGFMSARVRDSYRR
jgi:hypothetical protein